MNVTDYQEIWQIDIGGQIYEANFEVLTQWIYEGSLLPQDMVKRGNLRWIEARKVPALLKFFNAKEQGLPPPVVTSTAGGQPTGEPAAHQTQNFVPPSPTVANPYQTTITEPAAPYQPSHNPFDQPPPVHNFENNNWQEPAWQQNQQAANFAPPPAASPDFCSMHPEEPASFLCETCGNGFCKVCPKSFGGTVKICPFCGAMCKSVKEFKEKSQQAYQFQHDISEGFGFGDFFNALAYPFKYKTSLFFGALMFMFFSLGQSAAGTGSIFLVGAAIICWMLSNMLTFGVLANTVDNFSQGKIGGNFMPSFDDFSLWDDVVHPFFLSIGVYLVSFGLLAAIIIGSIFYTIKTVSSQIGSMQQDEQSRFLTDKDSPIKDNPSLQKQKDLYGDGNMPDEDRMRKAESRSYDEEKEFKRLNDMIQEQRKKQLESGLGKTPETKQKEMQQMAMNLLKMAVPVLILGFLAFLWGVFYYPAACCVAGYTRSFWATINPTVGLETIKLLGVDYLKLWLMTFALSIIGGIVGFIIGLILSPFNMPTFGNVPATAITSFIGFYFAVVFAVVVGFALYKNSEKLKLFKA
ncbi:MAG: hypothetical protein JSS81_27930 [Acidobacteria bacterium]|nr:hypothetical protein [Acidobacteriota bacterium]